ncbi:haloacid dehalogenase-like hydrolase [Halorhabdus rudnickae]|uniref:haloacid dehalogenase-like hydrolase n=1 Tax=Halorhabdus rudnickae TaxID=1775544 RepID=UPI001082FA26|nr:haloacid dehalogenase-like hydrolase [Halorhabdus rudnickae]
MVSDSSTGITAGDRVALVLDIDGTVHRHGSIFVESLALLPYVGDISLDEADRDTLRDVLGSVAAYAGGDRSRRRWLGMIRVCDVLAAAGLGRPVARLLAGLVRYRARRASASATAGDAGDYREMQRRILDRYGTFLDGRHRERVQGAFERVVERHVRVDPEIRRVIADLASVVDLDVVLVTDVPTHIARPYAASLGDEIDVIGTDFATSDGRFTGEYTFVDKGAAVDRLHTEREWEYVLAAGDSANDLPMAAAADLLMAVAGRGNLLAELPAEYRSIELSALRTTQLAADTDAIIVPRETSVTDALRQTFTALGVSTREPRAQRSSDGVD